MRNRIHSTAATAGNTARRRQPSTPHNRILDTFIDTFDVRPTILALLKDAEERLLPGERGAGMQQLAETREMLADLLAQAKGEIDAAIDLLLACQLALRSEVGEADEAVARIIDATLAPSLNCVSEALAEALVQP